MKNQPITCPECGQPMHEDDPGELSYSHGETDDMGVYVINWWLKWFTCEAGHIIIQWWEESPPADFAENAMPTDEFHLLDRGGITQKVWHIKPG